MPEKYALRRSGGKMDVHGALRLYASHSDGRAASIWGVILDKAGNLYDTTKYGVWGMA